MSFTPIGEKNPLILASGSPRRKQLLMQMGIPFRSIPGNIDESPPEGGPSACARSLAEKKARAVAPGFADNWIVGADTIVVLGDIIFGKPAGPGDVLSMLNLLCDEEHEVITGYCVLDPLGETASLDHTSTLVKMKQLSREEIDAYMATGEPYGKAGSYAIQGIGSFMVESISGSYSNVVGLPLCDLIRTLIAVGALERYPYTV